jgi:C-terminal processing protease CtpA/Prc
MNTAPELSRQSFTQKRDLTLPQEDTRTSTHPHVSTATAPTPRASHRVGSTLAVGDVVTSIDGMNVTGLDVDTAASLLRVPLSTAIELGLARGTTITIVTAAQE